MNLSRPARRFCVNRLARRNHSFAVAQSGDGLTRGIGFVTAGERTNADPEQFGTGGDAAGIHSRLPCRANGLADTLSVCRVREGADLHDEGAAGVVIHRRGDHRSQLHDIVVSIIAASELGFRSRGRTQRLWPLF